MHIITGNHQRVQDRAFSYVAHKRRWPSLEVFSLLEILSFVEEQDGAQTEHTGCSTYDDHSNSQVSSRMVINGHHTDCMILGQEALNALWY